MQSEQKAFDQWAECRLRDLASVNPEQLREDTPSETILDYIDLGAVEQVGHVPKPEQISFGEAPSRARRRALPGDVLASTVRPYLRGFTRLIENGEPRNLVASTGYAVIRPNEPLDGEFIYQHVLSQGFLDHLVPRMTGSNYPAVSASDVEDYPLACPPPEQRRYIGTVLTSVDDTIEQTRAVIDQTRKLKTALLQDLLTYGLPGRKTRFQTVRLGQAFAPRKERGIPGLPLVAVTMHNGLVDRSEIDRRMETNLADEQHLLVRTGDIAYNMMRMWQGVFGYAFCDCLVSPAYVVVQPTGPVQSDYAAYLFKLPETIHKFHLYSQGLTDDRLRLYYEQFAPIRVRVPKSLEDQQKIVSLLSSVDERLEAQLRELEQLTSTKMGLSQALLTGRVRVPSKGGE